MQSKELLRRIDKRDYLTEREHREFLDRLNKDLEDYEELKSLIGTPIQELMKELKQLEIYKKEIYKHWNIFFNAVTLEYLLYLEKKGEESFMTSIPKELYFKIKEHFCK